MDKNNKNAKGKKEAGEAKDCRMENTNRKGGAQNANQTKGPK